MGSFPWIMEGDLTNNSTPECSVDFRQGNDREFFWISGVLLVIIGHIGLIGNIFTMAVLRNQQMRKSVFNNLLLALCCFDTLFILTFGPYKAYNSLACHPLLMSESYLKTLSWPLTSVGWLGSLYMTVAISIERYLGIVHPNLQFP